jgi:hypothetical protein
MGGVTWVINMGLLDEPLGPVTNTSDRCASLLSCLQRLRQILAVDPGLAVAWVYREGPEPPPRPRQNMARFQMSQARLSLMVRGSLRP